MDSGGPYINAAFFCERVIEERDGTLSAIRIVDRITNMAVGTGTPAAMPAMPVNLALLIALKPGRALGRHDVQITAERPSGIRTDMASALSVNLEGGDRGANLVMNLSLVVTEEGLYWFDVVVDETVLTRVPLRVLYQRQEAGPPPGESGSPGPSGNRPQL